MRNARLIKVVLPAMLSATLLVGCSLTALDGFSDGAPSGADGAASGDASPTTDAADDRVVLDPTGDAMAKPFCASLSPQPALCLDFDGDPAFGLWSIDTTKGCKVEPSTTTFVSGPRAGYFSRPTGAGKGATMVLRYAVPTSDAPGELVLDADVRIEQTASDDELDVMAVTFLVGGGAEELQLSVVDGAYWFQHWSYLSDGGMIGTDDPFQRPIALGKWQHLRFTIQLGSTRKARLDIDGVPSPEISFGFPSGAGSPTIELGDGYLVGNPSAFYMDNFTATLK